MHTINELRSRLSSALDERAAQAAVIKDDLEASNTDLIFERNDAVRRLGSVTDQNRHLRKWIAELRDTQEERGQGPADPLYSMLLERIEPLVKADPSPDSAEGVRLVALVELCEAYEKRKGAWPAVVERPTPIACGARHSGGGMTRDLLCRLPRGHEGPHEDSALGFGFATASE